ncbi:hypothetical protein, conserved [Eimeria brunetti]|uniref:Uncharacterized protein n=1 Tax=Eimeria brunetti TaxID=51314 RepID=U6LXT7_9EIME|nr:hypothetical protein, conserved [Eimeria brunetti]
MMKNRSASHTKWNPIDAYTEQKDREKSEEQIACIRELLNRETAAGFVLVFVEKPPESKNQNNQEIHYCPVAGGVVEVLDSYERSVRAIWCRRSLPMSVSSALMRVLALRLFAYGFASSHQSVAPLLAPGAPGASKGSGAPGASKGSGGGPGAPGASGALGASGANRLVSCTEASMCLFPREAADFLRNQICMSRHWETPLDGGSHIDHPKAPCRCSSVRNVAGAWQFSGISLSRFVSYWRNHGRGALLDLPAAALSFFGAPEHQRPGLGGGETNGAKRPRRHLYDAAVKTAAEERARAQAQAQPPTSGAAGGEAASKAPAAEEGKTAAAGTADIGSASRRGLKRDRAIPTMRRHLLTKPRGRADAGRGGGAAEKKDRGTARKAELPAFRNSVRCKLATMSTELASTGTMWKASGLLTATYFSVLLSVKGGAFVPRCTNKKAKRLNIVILGSAGTEFETVPASVMLFSCDD